MPRSLAAIVLIATLTLASARLSAQSYELDASHTAVYFKISHLGMSHTFGRFNDVAGSFTLGDKAHFHVTIDAASVDTGWEKRDDHLRSPDFFSVKQFPEITFEASDIAVSGDTYTVTGDLTLLGETKPLTIVFTKLGEGKDPWGKDRIGFAGEVTIQRSAFGMTKYVEEGTVGDDVTLMISFEGVKQ